MSHGGNWKDLVKAAGDGDAPLTKYHLAGGIDPNFQHPEYFTAPIFEAIRNGHLPIVRILVEQGKADPNLLEELSDQTPLEMALDATTNIGRRRRHEIVDYLNSQLPPESQMNVRQVLVTGGNRGIGKAICQTLLEQGHCVVFTCRSKEVGDATLQELQESTGNSKIKFIVGDLSSIQSTRRLAESIEKQFHTINVLIHNAGIWPTKMELNEDGVELSFMVNYVAPCILTRHLHPLLEENGPSRIVLVTAGLYALGRADLTTTPYGKDFSSLKTYMNTKQCGMLFFLHWTRRLLQKQQDNNAVTINAVHPGVIRTDLGSQHRNCCLACILRTVKRFWGKPSQGAVGPAWLAASPEAQGVHGRYYDHYLNETALSASVLDEDLQEDWERWTQDFLARSGG